MAAARALILPVVRRGTAVVTFKRLVVARGRCRSALFTDGNHDFRVAILR